jgi:hypothetical protein
LGFGVWGTGVWGNGELGFGELGLGVQDVGNWNFKFEIRGPLRDLEFGNLGVLDSGEKGFLGWVWTLEFIGV